MVDHHFPSKHSIVIAFQASVKWCEKTPLFRANSILRDDLLHRSGPKNRSKWITARTSFLYIMKWTHLYIILQHYSTQLHMNIHIPMFQACSHNENAMFTKHDLPGNDVASAEGESRDHRRGRFCECGWGIYPPGFNGCISWDPMVI